TIPATLINQVPEDIFDWLVPGLLPEKLEALIRGLPKAKRRNFVPVPEYVKAVMESIDITSGPLLSQLSQVLARITGVTITLEQWQEVLLPEHLMFNFKIVSDGEILAKERDLSALKKRFSGRAVQAIRKQTPVAENPQGTRWIFGDLPEVVEQQQDGVMLRAWPALYDLGKLVEQRLFHRQDEAAWQHQIGLARLMLNQLPEQAKLLEQYRNKLPGFQK